MMRLSFLLLVLCTPSVCFAFSSTTTTTLPSQQQQQCHSTSALFASISDRRSWCLQQSSLLLSTTAFLPPSPVFAEDEQQAAAAAVAPAVPLRHYTDPQGMFALDIPQRYYALRRSAKGDLPNANSGQGRRGASIFTAGDMARAQVIAIEKYPLRVLLEENGVILSPEEDLAQLTFPKLGNNPAALATLINNRRERDSRAGQTSRVVSARYSDSGLDLCFMLRAEVEAQRPELLAETYGVTRLFRVTQAKATLATRDGQLMAVFASGLEQDLLGSGDGAALAAAVESFVGMDPNKGGS